MKLSPKVKFTCVFWFVTIPIIPFVLLLVLIAILNPFYRQDFLQYIEETVYRVTNWRNAIPIVKYYREKATLFDMLKA